MTRRFLIILAALLLAGQLPLRAGNPARREGSVRLLYGLEWGYDLTVLDIHHYNYTDEADGYRIDENKVRPMSYSNGHASMNLTLEFAKHFGLGIHAGYAGIQQRTRIFPVSLRSSYFFNSYNSDSPFLFLEGGAGFHESRTTISPFGKIGFGRRTNLSKRCSLDLSGSLRITADHPPIYDATIPGYVAEENVRRSDAAYGAVVLAIGLNF